MEHLLLVHLFIEQKTATNQVVELPGCVLHITTAHGSEVARQELIRHKFPIRTSAMFKFQMQSQGLLVKLWVHYVFIRFINLSMIFTALLWIINDYNLIITTLADEMRHVTSPGGWKQRFFGRVKFRSVPIRAPVICKHTLKEMSNNEAAALVWA